MGGGAFGQENDDEDDGVEDSEESKDEVYEPSDDEE